MKREQQNARTAVSRCIWILERLRDGSPRFREELERDLGISQRTLARDLSALRAAGVQIQPTYTGRRYVGIRLRGVSLDMARVRRAS